MSETSSLSSSEAPEGGFVCLVDGNGEYNLSKEKLRELIAHVDPNGTRDYSIVGIMGVQSSGKSTLLNKLFKTKFQMMNSRTGRQQTTRGIWLDAARNTPNLVIMDLEGTDSGERGEDRTTFERQTILYGLALCEILIVNMWEHDIGRYTASNYGVLKTVFEVNLQIFKAQGKTMLLFIVRDHIEQTTPAAALETKLRKDIQNIWDELSKPEDQKDAKLDDHFEFRFEFLPHMVLQANEFDTAVTSVRDRFIEAKREDSYLNTPYHGQKSVPADGFAHYSEQVWTTIKTNQDLNLPSQRELLSTFRCDELATQAFNSFTTAFATITEATKAGFVSDVGAKLGDAVNAALQQYDTSADRYVPELVAKKRSELIAKLSDGVVETLDQQMTAHVDVTALKLFQSKLKQALPSGHPCPDFFGTVSRIRSEHLKHFNDSAKSLSHGIPDAIPWDYSKHVADFESGMDAFVADQRSLQLKLIAAEGCKHMYDKCIGEMTRLLQLSELTMWESLGQLFKSSFESAYAAIEPALLALKPDNNETQSIKRRVISEGEAYVVEAARQHAQIVDLKMRAYFDQHFTKDADGLQRRWTPSDDIRREYVRAKESALALLPLFATVRLREFWGSEITTVMTSDPNGSFTFPSDSSASSSSSSSAPIVEMDLKESSSSSSSVSPSSSPSSSPASGTLYREHDFDKWVSVSHRRRSVFVPTLPPIEILSEDVVMETERNFTRYMETAFLEAQAEQERARQQQGLPTWAYALIGVLGFNEFIAIITSPFVIYPAIFLGLVFIILVQAGMWGPVYSMLLALGRQIYQQGYFHIYGKYPPAPQSSPSSPPSSSSSSSLVRDPTDPKAKFQAARARKVGSAYSTMPVPIGLVRRPSAVQLLAGTASFATTPSSSLLNQSSSSSSSPTSSTSSSSSSFPRSSAAGSLVRQSKPHSAEVEDEESDDNKSMGSNDNTNHTNADVPE